MIFSKKYLSRRFDGIRPESFEAQRVKSDITVFLIFFQFRGHVTFALKNHPSESDIGSIFPQDKSMLMDFNRLRLCLYDFDSFLPYSSVSYLS